MDIATIGPALGLGGLCQHNLEHNRALQASSIIGTIMQAREVKLVPSPLICDPRGPQSPDCGSIEDFSLLSNSLNHITSGLYRTIF